ncbi:TetR/AcrR family transcriptional regulator [Virgibacillus sp. NKC19-16]|uniref:TetR/AcrR family transcriptional regulator n=1 Tax=Virgibacillus salidurans TaxID=2831673 RepID=UPI001F298F76|nr:TetR/AcrR family transcriptional regulator [Virgibacillus sp. NKC19-16]UJL46009.1 TetR/AcrR family transcriptional regulator [Virgibacillus sp. NKC19-16]
MNQDKILSSVKDQELVEKRRNQMIQGAVTLFKEKGFHRTTTREIAKESGFSIGTLYEYIRTKEDILFLVVDSIHRRVRDSLEAKIDLKHPSTENLVALLESYFRLMDDMQEEVLILYQEVKSLKKEARAYVLRKERDMVGMLEHAIVTCLPNEISKQDAELLANNIFVHGQMWGFRRWILQKQFTLDEYIDRQIHYIFSGLAMTT